MALPTIVKIYNRSDFTVQLPLAEGYDGQEFRFTLYTCGEPENGWVASYIDGAYSNCSVLDDIVTIYVNNNNHMNPGCLTVRSEYDYFNGHFADNEDNVKDVYKTNIYLVDYRTNAFSASFRPSNMPDLTNTVNCVTFDDLNAMGYITMSDVSECGYMTATDVEGMLSGYATETYVAEYVSQYEYDMSAYVTHDELNEASYAPRTLLMFKQDTLVSGQNIKTINNESILGSGNLNVVTDLTGYATETYVVDYVATYAPQPDLSPYVTQDALSQMGYITTIPSEYVTQSELEACGYVTNEQLDSTLNSYATQSYVTEKISQIPSVDLSGYVSQTQLQQELGAYVSKTELNEAGYITVGDVASMGYITSIPSEYATYEAISNMGYVTEGELAACGYITVGDVASMGYITSIPSEYVTESEIAQMSYITQDELSANAYLTEHQDLSGYVSKTELDNAGYVTQTNLSSIGYATQTYVAQYVSDHTGDIDLSAYVTHDELNNASYATTYELTQAEYDNLVNNNLTDQNTLYIISDAEVADLSYYATKSYVVEYVATYAPTPDLSAYVTKTELDNAGYLTSVPANYVTQETLSAQGYITMGDVAACGYITTIPSEYVTEGELEACAYATQTYVADYVATYAGGIVDLSSYVTYDFLTSQSYITQSSLSANSYASVIEVTSNEYNNLSYNEKHNGAIYVITDIEDDAYYVTYTDLNTYLSSYATQTYVAEYVASYGGNVDLSSYVTYNFLSSQSYATQTYVADYVASYGGGTASVYTLTYAQYQDLVQNDSYDPNTLYAISDGVPIDLANYVEKSCLEAYYVPKTYIDTYYVAKSDLNYDSSTNTLTITI